MAPMTITTTKNGQRIERTVDTVGQLMILLRELGVPVAASILGTAA